MPQRYYVWVSVLVLQLAVLAGCKTSPTRPAPRADASPVPGPPVESPEVLEQRAEAHARYATALVLELDQEPEKALEQYRRAALADPENEGLVLDVSRRLVQAKQIKQAEELLKKAISCAKASGALFARLGNVYLQGGKTNLAIQANETAIRKMPHSISGYQNLYRLYLQTRQTNEATRVLEEAARHPKPDAIFLVELAEMYLARLRPPSRTNDPAAIKAREALIRATDLHPTNYVVMQKMADGLNFLGDTKRATQLYLQLVEDYPFLPGTREKLADIYLRARDKENAAEQLEAIARDNPTNPQAHYYLGTLAYEDKRLEDAVKYYRQTIMLNPNIEQVYYDLAAAQIGLNQPRAALNNLDKAKARFNESFVGEFFTALAYGRLKDHTNAVHHFTAAEIIGRATETNRLTHIFYFQFGSACERMGNYAEAEQLFKKCLDISPDFTECLNYLGYMWAERGTNLAEARVLIEKALKAEPKNAAYLDSLGWVLFKQGEFREALTYMEQALGLLEEPDATLYDHLGDIHAALNNHEKAREAWQKSVGVEANETVEAKLKNIRSAGSPAK